MDYYKVQFKIPKKSIRKTSDIDLQWHEIRKLIKSGIAELSVFEKSDEEFERPDGLPSFPNWNTKLPNDILLETTLGLSEEEAKNNDHILQRIDAYIELCNIFDYIYEDEQGLHVSLAFLDEEEFPEAEFLTAEDKKKTGKPEMTAEEMAAKKQIDMFKRKSK